MRDGLDGCGKSRLPPTGFDPWTVQQVTSPYTEYIIPSHKRLQVDALKSSGN